LSAGTAIGMVSESLQQMLVSEWTLQPGLTVTILSPDEAAGDRRVNLFLYRVSESPYLRNLDWQVRPGSGGKLVPPPLSLNLFYLLTAYAPNDPQTGNATAQEMLGEAMRALYENPVVPEKYLVKGLKDALEEIRVVQVPLDFEAMARLWSTFGHPYRTSAGYEVSVVQLDRAGGSPPAVPARVRTIGVAEPGAPFRPPLVLAMAPAAGPAGTTLEFAGEHLEGWRADVRITGEAVLTSFPLTGGAFSATIPAALGPGLHQVHVDVSGLFRRVFLFEVTA
jgi:Pvc16 N-terminal domain